NRFNLFLQRLNRRRNDQQKGLMIMDESRHEGALQSLARDFRMHGARWGHFRNLAEVPLFVDSKASRLVQLADLVALGWRACAGGLPCFRDIKSSPENPGCGGLQATSGRLCRRLCDPSASS